MSFLSDLQAYSQSQLRRTTTRVTNSLGQTHCESKLEDGSFQIDQKSAESNDLFMVIDRSDDENLHYVVDGVYIGSQDAALNVSALNHCKITHILNVATGISNAFPERYKYLNIELLDLPQANIRQVFSRTNEFIQEAVVDDGCVLIHCNAGISRSASIVLAYLLGIHLMRYEDAYNLLKTARSKIRPNEGFVAQLKDYGVDISRRNEIDSPPIDDIKRTVDGESCDKKSDR